MEEIDLVQFKERRSGIELENPLVTSDCSLITKEIMQDIWHDFVLHGWTEKNEVLTGDVLGAEKIFNGKKVVANTDGSWSTFELALPPCETIQESEEMIQVIHAEILPIFKKHNVQLLGLGLNPGHSSMEDKYLTAKPFYKVIKQYWYLFNTCFPANANQANVSIRVDEAIRAINNLTAVSGVVTALMANASIADWKVLPWKEFRYPLLSGLFSSNDYSEIDCVIHKPWPRPFTSLADYFNSFLGSKSFMNISPMRDGQFVVLDKKMTWIEYLKGKEWTGVDMGGNKKTLTPNALDLTIAMNNQWFLTSLHIFYNDDCSIEAFVRAFEEDTMEEFIKDKINNFYLEYRVAAAQPKGDECAFTALTLGLIENLDALEEFVKKYSWEEWSDLIPQTAIRGFDSEMQGTPVTELARTLLDIARHGLEKRAHGEEKYLESLHERAQSGKAPADRMNMLLVEKGRGEFIKEVSYFES